MKTAVSALVAVLLVAGPSAAAAAAPADGTGTSIAVATDTRGTTGFFHDLMCVVLKKRC